MLSKEGTKVDLQKVKAVTECPKPTNVTRTINFLGLAGYYRVLGRNFFLKITSSPTNLFKEVTKLAKR